MIICKICNKEFNKTISFSYHLKNHNISKKDYLIKFDFDGIHPTCLCGCGKEVTFSPRRKQRGRNGFCKYYKDHYKRVQSEITKGKLKDLSYLDIDVVLKKYQIDSETLENSYNDYMNFQKSMRQILNDVSIDKRTLISWWNKLGLIKDKAIFRRTQKRHQGFWKPKKEIDLNKIFDIYQFIKKNPNIFTISNLKIKFRIKESRLILQRTLYDQYGKEEIDKLISIGNSSKAELDLYFILVYYFGQKNVKRQFKIEKKYYDYKLGEKILIEYDGDYWHSRPDSIKNDNLKNDLATKNGYILFRIKESESRNIEILKKIEKLWKKSLQ